MVRLRNNLMKKKGSSITRLFVKAMPMEASGMLANATVEQHLLNGIAAMVMSLNSSG